MTESENQARDSERVWRTYMKTGEMPDWVGAPWYRSNRWQRLIRRLPAESRCRICQFPFEGLGGVLARTILGVERSKLNPQMCDTCDRGARRFPGGAEIEVSILFADVRGSTRLGAQMSPAEFSRLIDRFYKAATGALFERNGLVEKLIGDEVTAFFVPGFAGGAFALEAVEAGLEVLRATGHGDSEGPWVPVGVGVHTGVAYVGSVSSEGGEPDITVLGDTPNIASRLTAQAQAGELLISEATREAAGLARGSLEHRRLKIKGREEEVEAWMRRIPSG